MHGLQHQIGVHLMDFVANAKISQKGDRQFATQMLTELIQPFQNDWTIIVTRSQKGRVEDTEPKMLQQGYDPFFGAFRQQACQNRIPGIQRNPDGNSFTMANMVVGQCLQFVCSPVPEIQRPGRSPPLAIWFMCNCADRRIMYSSASRWNVISASALASSHS